MSNTIRKTLNRLVMFPTLVNHAMVTQMKVKDKLKENLNPTGTKNATYEVFRLEINPAGINLLQRSILTEWDIVY